MKINLFHLSILFIFFSIYLFSKPGFSQITTDNSPGSGITLTAKDSSFSTKFGVRFQTLYTGTQDLENSEWRENLLVRRLRLKFDGYVLSPQIEYKVELGLSDRDIQDGAIPESGNTANIVLDAVIQWNFAGNWELWAGQTKLPGNRERVISSQNMQFVDRSLVNSSFTLDRDIGIQLHHKFNVSKFIFKQAFALSKGEGRNIVISNPNSGREFTGRLEFLPLGSFTQNGDYFGSDLMWEDQPKLSIGITGDYNSSAVRSRGNLGAFISDTTESDYESTNLATLMVDGILKYKGWSLSSEYARRTASNPVDGFGYGSGIFGAIGYLFPANIEIAGRYTKINPISAFSSISPSEEYTLGFSWYIKAHDLKVQSDISHLTEASREFIVFRVQCELAL